MPGVKVNVHVSRENKALLEELSLKSKMPKGRIVDDALTLFFTPLEERSDRILLRRFDLVEDAIERTNANVSFSADMLAEFVWRWLKRDTGLQPGHSIASDAQALDAFEAFTRAVVERGSDG
jgi:hypothetical protein